MRIFLLSLAATLAAQVIEFENNGLQYQTLTRGGVTIMYAHLPTSTTREYAAMQVAISNGSKTSWMVKPDDFSFRRTDGGVVKPEPPRNVVSRFLDRGSRQDVIRLTTTYEASLYGLSRIQSTNGYEQRRQQMLGEMSSAKIKAAAAASAIVFVSTKLKAGESTDGAIFFPMPPAAKSLGQGKLVVQAAGETFEFLLEENGKIIDK